jgi:hypothetical protein
MAINSTIANQLLEATLAGNTFSYTGSANVYMALYSDVNAATELDGSDYARQEIAFTMDTANTRAVSTDDVVFGPADGDWLIARSWSVTDASTAGNVLYSGALTVSQSLKDTYTLTFTAGDVIITLD